ncbi:MAG TPA: hypothetical protein VIJ99_01810 [Acidimicrobiales bacterium]
MSLNKGPRRPRPGAQQPDEEPGAPLGIVLDRLRSTQSGVAFIYGAMEIVVSRLGLRDMVIVLHDGREGNQIFRYAGKPISPDRTLLVHAPPGVYCDPELVDDPEVAILFDRCRREFENLRSVGDAATGVISYRRYRAAPEIVPLEETDDVELDVVLGESVEATETAPSGVYFSRLVVSRAFVVIVVLNLLFDALNLSGSLRFLFGLVLGVAIPGWSFVGLLNLRNVALEISLSIAASLSTIMVSAQILITIHFWQLGLYEAVLCCACLPSLLFQSRWRWSDVRERLRPVS